MSATILATRSCVCRFRRCSACFSERHVVESFSLRALPARAVQTIICSIEGSCRIPLSENPMARNPPDTRTAAEKAFKAATTRPADLPAKAPSIPGAKETVSLRIDRDVLEFFQEDGPGWQDRINAALRKAAGK